MNPEEAGKKARPPGKTGRSGRFAKGWVFSKTLNGKGAEVVFDKHAVLLDPQVA